MIQSEEAEPIDFGLMVFLTFQYLDVFGSLDALNIMSRFHDMSLYIIAKTMD